MMKFKLSSTKLLSIIIGLFILLLLGLLVYSLKSMNGKYDDYKLGVIMNSPYESYARITDKFTMGKGFEIEYQFRGKSYGRALKVRNELFDKYQEGDKIPITLSRHQPSLVALTSELRRDTPSP